MHRCRDQTRPFGTLPHRRDCVAALAPGVLVFDTAEKAPATPDGDAVAGAVVFGSDQDLVDRFN